MLEPVAPVVGPIVANPGPGAIGGGLAGGIVGGLIGIGIGSIVDSIVDSGSSSSGNGDDCTPVRRAALAAEPGSSPTLRTNMARVGGLPTFDRNDAHHIVPGRAAGTARRALIHRFCIGINDEVNGVFLRRSGDVPGEGAVHQGLHEAWYFADVSRRLAHAANRGEAEWTLRGIASVLERGDYSGQPPTWGMNGPR